MIYKHVGALSNRDVVTCRAMLQCRKECAPAWICSFISCDPVFLCRPVNSLCAYWQLPDKCIGTAKRDKPRCSSLPIASVFNLRQALNHRNQQFRQRSEIIWFQKLRSTVALHWNMGNHNSTFCTSVIVSKTHIWRSISGNLGAEGKVLVAFKKIYFLIIIISYIFSTNSSFL